MSLFNLQSIYLETIYFLFTFYLSLPEVLFILKKQLARTFFLQLLLLNAWIVNSSIDSWLEGRYALYFIRKWSTLTYFLWKDTLAKKKKKKKKKLLQTKFLWKVLQNPNLIERDTEQYHCGLCDTKGFFKNNLSQELSKFLLAVPFSYPSLLSYILSLLFKVK